MVLSTIRFYEFITDSKTNFCRTIASNLLSSSLITMADSVFHVTGLALVKGSSRSRCLYSTKVFCIEPVIPTFIQRYNNRQDRNLYSVICCRVWLFATDCSLPGSSVHGILQTRILKWIAIPFSRGSSQPRDWTWASWIAGRFFTIWATREHVYKTIISLYFFLYYLFIIYF